MVIRELVCTLFWRQPAVVEPASGHRAPAEIYKSLDTNDLNSPKTQERDMSRDSRRKSAHPLAVGRSEGIAEIVLNRPEARNALNADLVDRIENELELIASDPGLGAVVIRGCDPGFCAGSDLKELATMTPREAAAHEGATARMVRKLSALPIPTIVAVEGFAIGGGFLLAAACDIVVSADDTRWDLPEVRLGWVPPWGLAGLIDRAGVSWARRLAWADQAWDTKSGVRNELVTGSV